MVVNNILVVQVREEGKLSIKEQIYLQWLVSVMENNLS
jgi:hypothetical protein